MPASSYHLLNTLSGVDCNYAIKILKKKNLIVLSKVVAAIPFLGNGVSGRTAIAPDYKCINHSVVKYSITLISGVQSIK